MQNVESVYDANSAATEEAHAASVSLVSKSGRRDRTSTVARLPAARRVFWPVVMCAANEAVSGNSHTISVKSIDAAASAANAVSKSAAAGAGANVRTRTMSPAMNAPALGAAVVTALVLSAAPCTALAVSTRWALYLALRSSASTSAVESSVAMGAVITFTVSAAPCTPPAVRTR